MELARRNFIKATVAAGAAAVALGTAGGAKAAETAAEGESPAATETLDCDVVVVGGGMSGLAAAVQAGINGDSVVLLEASGAVGGAGNGVEGVFAVDSPLQQEQGIEVDAAEVLADETSSTNYTNSGLHWRDMIKASGDNVAWLLEQGAEFSGVIDGYMPGGRFNTFHWWKNGCARDGYVPAMSARLEELGVDVRVKTLAKELILEDGTVKGLLAQTDNGWLQVNSKAVILSAGGFIGNTDLLSQQMLISPEDMAEACLENSSLLHRMGDDVKMALAAGARVYPGSCVEGWYQPANVPVGDAAMIRTLKITDDVTFIDLYVRTGLGSGCGRSIWVQEDAQRFTNEAAALSEIERTFSTRRFYKEHYQIFDQALVDDVYGEEPLKSAFEQFMADYPSSILKADTVAELANLVGLDADALEETLSTYNAYCAEGKDGDFGRPAEYLTPIDTAPFYIFRCEICGDATLGGICVDRNFRALDAQKNPIPGLYMAGVDSCMLFNCVYPIGVPGAACCNSINSGRTSANTAHEDMKA